MITKKAKEERQLRLSKTGGTSTGGAGKKKIKGQVNVGASFKKDNIDDFIGGDDDFGDDDFILACDGGEILPDSIGTEFVDEDDSFILLCNILSKFNTI
ncbi:unnamed protein product [[Candida] boidinii]|nr:unnamed protein product [[Candida] boidinii]